MIADLRTGFNSRWTPERYRSFLSLLDQKAGTRVTFRVSETPCFLPQALVTQLASTGVELLQQLVDDPTYRASSDAAIPTEFNVPGEPPHPLFAAVDFNLVRNLAGALEPRLIELQGFPSLYGFQTIFAQAYAEAYGLDSNLRVIADGSDVQTYQARLREAILGGHDPEDVVLLEIHPLQQKTLPDFVVTERICGIRTVCITEVEKEGRQLYYQRDGKRTPIRRIYNRVIVDELQRKGVAPPFRFTDELDVEWAGHPNWFFRISKFSLPFLNHPCVPRTWFLDKVPVWPDDLDNYVLKPLYSFAGLGVVVGPSRSDLQAIPRERLHDYILQERLRFEPMIETPHGPAQAEIRILYIWPQDSGSPPWLGPIVVRMGRGKMMGVDHNRDLEWVGASAGLIL